VLLETHLYHGLDVFALPPWRFRCGPFVAVLDKSDAHMSTFREGEAADTMTSGVTGLGAEIPMYAHVNLGKFTGWFMNNGMTAILLN